MQWLSLSDRVCCPRAMMESHTRRRFTLCMLSKCDDGMPRPTSSDRVWCPRDMMEFYARRSRTIYFVKG